MSNLRKSQKSFGLALSKELENYDWQTKCIKPEGCAYYKDIGNIRYQFGFALRSRNPYLIFSGQCVIFLDLTNIIKQKFSHIVPDDMLIVSVSMDYEHIETSDLRIDKDNPNHYAPILAKRIADAENELFPKYANHEYILKRNSSPRHWEWLTSPYQPYAYSPYAFYMISYAIFYNKPELIATAFERLNTVKEKISDASYNIQSIENTNKLFKELGFEID